MMAILLKIKEKEKESLSIKMGINFMVNGNQIKKKEKVFILGKTEVRMKEIGKAG